MKRRTFFVAGRAALAFLLVACATTPGSAAEGPGASTAEKPVGSIDELWAGFDPRALPLEVEVVRAWDEGDIRLEMIYFTGEIFEGEKTRVFGYLGRPKRPEGKVPGILHIHGGGQTAYLDWPRFWARHGYVCLSFDFCGNTNLPTLGPEYRRERYTLWGKVPANMMQVGGGGQMKPTPRHNPWFHWALTARRGLTLLEQQPEVDGKRLGIFGISVGGTLTWTVAGVDRRVKAAAPIYGAGWEFYPYPLNPDAPTDEGTRLLRTLIAPEKHAPRITCPLLLLSATNDGHGKMDLAYKTLDLLGSPVRSQIFSANYDHHVEPDEARSLPAFMDVHLRGRSGPWPETPKLDVAGVGVPQLRLAPSSPGSVERVDLYYCLNNNWPTRRFWRSVANVRRQGDVFVGEAPFLNSDDVIFAFGNVTYRSGARISSRLVRKPIAEIPEAKPTLARQAIIDSMETPNDWNWVPAYTDPNQEGVAFFAAWRADDGSRGFTLDPRMFPSQSPASYYFGTRKIGDPQYRGKDSAAILIDCLADRMPEKLTVRLSWRSPGTHGEDYDATPDLTSSNKTKQPESGHHGVWTTLRMEPAGFRNKDGKPLPDWDHVEYFILVGTNPAGKPPVFKNLRWEPQPSHP